MSRVRAGIVIAIVHVLLVCSLGAKLIYDRHRYPRIWAKTRPYDPDLPIRGRYLSLQLEVEAEGFSLTPNEQKELSDTTRRRRRWDNVYRSAKLELRGNRLVAVPYEGPGSRHIWIDSNDLSKATWSDPILYFIPEHAEDPSRQPAGSSLWVEVTMPKKGPPRPIQLAVSKASGWHVLDLH
jgi:hypothetical protein